MKQSKIDIPIPNSKGVMALKKLDNEVLKDKILGAIVGSAIGDAMGASTEMWDRQQIWNEHGYITGLTPAIRDKSPEGIWQHNMVPGSTTDDTRWKVLVGQYIAEQKTALNEEQFARFIINYYEQLIDGLSTKSVKSSTDVLEEELSKVDWIKEWARVAIAYRESRSSYAAAQNRFYGGEMSCAGMLYSPMFGLISKHPEEAYTLAFDHGLFDIGYARDISALVSVLTYHAMHFESMDSILDQSILVDPYKFTDSRLVGRLSRSMFDESRSFVTVPVIYSENSGTTDVEMPKNYPGSPEEWNRQSEIYKRLALKQKAIAFHSGEIWQILIAGLEFGQGDFLRSIQFIVNYGRDNDTVAAVAGMILGARTGFGGLPVEIRDKVVDVSREVMGLDLEELAEKLIMEEM